jgi:hypothetical protein
VKKILSILSALFLLFGLTGCAFHNLESSDGKESSANKENPANSGETVGDTIVGEDYSISLNGARYSTSGILGSKPSNDKFLILDLTIQNASTEELSVSTLLLMELQGSDSRRYDIAIFAETVSPIDGTIPPQGQLSGEVAFDVKELDSYTFSYKNVILSDSVQFLVPATSIN